MRYMKILGLLAVVAAALMAFAGSASATTVSTTTGGAAATPTIHAVNEGGFVTLSNSIANIECNVTNEGNVESHGAGTTVNGIWIRFDFFGCPNGWTWVLISAGTFSIHWTSGHNATITWSGGTFVAIRHTIFGTVECRYQTEETHLGTVTGGNPATLKIEGSIPFHSGGGLCGSGNSQMTGNLVTTSALYVAP